MSEARPTNPLVEQFRRGGVARDLRLMAAQGLLPLKPEDLLELWTDLAVDPDEGVGQRRRVLQDGVGYQPDTLGRDISGAIPDQRDTSVQALSELARDLDFAEAGRVRIGSRHRKEDGQHDATDGEDRAGPLSRATGRFRR